MLTGFRRPVVGVVQGGERFDCFSLEVEENDFVGAGMEPGPRRVQRKFRADIPEATERTCVKECDSFGEAVGVQKRVFDFWIGAGPGSGHVHCEAIEAWTYTGI